MKRSTMLVMAASAMLALGACGGGQEELPPVEDVAPPAPPAPAPVPADTMMADTMRADTAMRDTTNR